MPSIFSRNKLIKRELNKLYDFSKKIKMATD